jgi:hypothetical protein
MFWHYVPCLVLTGLQVAMLRERAQEWTEQDYTRVMLSEDLLVLPQVVGTQMERLDPLLSDSQRPLPCLHQEHAE